MRTRILLSILLAALCATVLVFRTYTDTHFERVRMRVVKEPIVATESTLAVALPDLSPLERQATALILRLRGASDADVIVSVNDTRLGRVSVPAGREVRADFAFTPERDRGRTLTLSTDTTGWTLSYVEISNLHGQARGWVNLLVLPQGRTHSRVVPGWLGVATFIVLVFAGTLRRAPPGRFWRVALRSAAAFAGAVLLLSLLSPAVGPYRLILSVGTAVLLTGLVFVEPLAGALSRLHPYLRPVFRFFRPDPRLLECGPLPSLREVSLAAGGFVVCTLVLLHQQVWQFGSVPDLGDPLFSMWRMAWVAHQLAADPARLFDANIFFPDRGALTYSDAMVLPALPNAVLRLFGAHPVTAYNLLFVSAFVFSAVTAYVLGRSLAFDVTGAWVAGLVFGFYSFRFEHYSHLELQLSGWMPIVLLAIHRIVMAGGGGRYVLAGGGALAAQWYSSMYFGLFLSVYVAAFATILLWFRGWPRKESWSVVWSLALGTLLALPLAAVYSAYGEQRGERAPIIVSAFSAVPLDYLESTDRRALYRDVTLGRATGERQLFPGVVPPILGLAGLASPFTTTRLAAAGAGLVAFDGSLGLNGLWYRLAYQALAPFQSIRVPARFAMLVGLSMAILAGAAATRWSTRLSGRRRAALAGLLTCALMADAWPALKLVPVWRDVPPIYDPLRGDADAVLIELPLNPVPESFPQNIPTMYFSIWHWTRMVNGYSGHLPEKYSEIVTNLEGFPTEETLTMAQQIGVTHVSVVCAIDGPHQAFGVPAPDVEGCREKIRRLDGSAIARPLVRTEWRGAPALLYELR